MPYRSSKEGQTQIYLRLHSQRASNPATPGNIVTLLREQVQIEAQDVVDKLTMWLDPFVDDLHILSVYLGEGVSLVLP